uniref:Uncharacterized protein n=1 Tax=Aeromonas sp. Ne-1 TaxID=1675689 RepID=A0A0H4JBX2_9GAMM|nr:hypothetical protein [Aeromonas sp. Ne-1]AKO69679.1 hypothetical protein [Aeromonas sp. Ne-1]
MKSLYPLFNEDKKNGQDSLNIRVHAPIQEKKRKTRIDKKKDVKVPLNASQRKLLKMLAKRKQTDPTNYCSTLLKRALSKKIVLSLPIETYQPKEKPISAKLEIYYHELLLDKSIEYDCSLRETAYKLISHMLILESSGDTII